MRNLKLTIEYDGTNYCGWQVQNSHKSIQGTIERTLQKILQEKIKLIASGRTDAGVHALAQVANFKTRKNIAASKLRFALNGNLPKDIVITKIEEVALDFNSRYSAKAKTYRYLILNRSYPSALLNKRVYVYPYPLNIKLMRQAAVCLLGRHDFKSFCASGSSVKSTVRNIKKISIRAMLANHKLGPLIAIDIEANGFLYNMVRSIVGTFLDIGRAKISRGSMKRILKARDRKLAGSTAPAHALYLMGVKY